MAKSKQEVTATFKIMAPAGAATPAPPLGPVLGQNGVNPGQFITKFNEKTKALKGKIVGCVVTVYKDRTFALEIKQPPASVMIKDVLKLEKGSGVPNKDKVGKITKTQLQAIAKEKMTEMTGHSVEAAMRTLAGTCRSMGVTVEG